MTPLKSCTIRLQNKSYEIKCPENESKNLQLAAVKLNTQVIAQKKKAKQLEAYDALLLAALHISHELIGCQQQQQQQQQQFNRLIAALEEQIRQAAADISSLNKQAD
ncbi:MAG: cell division protein ZapA [Legionella sp.]